MLKRKKSVNYAASDMYVLVDDIESYPEFLPWCRNSKVLSRTEDVVEATLILSAGGFHKSFTTRNRLQKNKMIEIQLINGPFRMLEGFWLFEPESEKSCTIHFELQFEFSSRLLDMAFSPVFNHAINTLVDAFCKRASDLYGKDPAVIASETKQ